MKVKLRLVQRANKNTAQDKEFTGNQSCGIKRK